MPPHRHQFPINRRHDPLAQILRVSSAHRNPPSNQQGKRITNKAPWESKRDSTRSENALEEISGHRHVLTPGRYVGAANVEDDHVPFEERFAALKAKLE